jgi:hypothetical protein
VSDPPPPVPEASASSSESPILDARSAAIFAVISALRYEIPDGPASAGPADALVNRVSVALDVALDTTLHTVGHRKFSA